MHKSMIQLLPHFFSSIFLFDNTIRFCVISLLLMPMNDTIRANGCTK